MAPRLPPRTVPSGCLARLPRRGFRTLAATRSPAAGQSQEPQPRPDWNQFISKPDPTEPQPTPSTPSTPSTSSFTLAVKDNIATLGTTSPTTCASQILQGYASPFEATVVVQLRDRGGVVVGKTNLDEFGMGSHSLNSHWGGVTSGSPDSTSVGGSSGGSAVAVRLGDADVALGTDTGGSVRLPAAYGGVVGYKPSYGMLSRFGVVPYANSLDTVGLLGKGVKEIERLVVGAPRPEAKEDGQRPVDSGAAYNGQGGLPNGGLWPHHDKNDPTSLSASTRLRLASQRSDYTSPTATHSLAGLSFGIPLEYNIAELDAPIRAAWTAAAQLLQSLGATVSAVSLPSTRHALSAYYVLAPAEAASNLSRYDGVRYGGGPEAEAETKDGSLQDSASPVLYERTRAAFGPEVQQRILLGAYALSSAARDNYFLQAQRVRRLVVRDFDAVFRLRNPLRDEDADEELAAVDLSDLPEGLPLANKRGPAQVDFLLCPTAPTAAPKVSDVTSAASPVDAYMNDVFTVPASLAGLPAISIPVPPPSPSTTFCPGLQLIGQFWDDARLLRVADMLMEASFTEAEDKEALAKHRQTGVVEA